LNPFNNSIRNLITKLVVTAIAFIIYLLIPKYIGPELFGIFSFQSAFVGLLIPLSSLGIGSGILYYISTHKYEVYELGYTILKIALLLALFNGTIVYALYWFGWMHTFDYTISMGQMILFSLAVFCQSFSFIMGRVFYGNSDFKILNIIEISSVFLSPLFLLTCFYLMGSVNKDFIYLSFCIFSMIVLIIHLFFIQSYWRQKPYNRKFAKEVISYGLKSWPGELAVRANLRLDQILMISFVSAGALGIYSMAVKLVELIWMIPDALGPVLFNRIAKQQDVQSSLVLIARLHRLVIVFSLFALMLLTLATYYFIIPYFLGAAFEQLMLPLILLIPGTLFLISTKIFTKLFSATGHVHWTSKISIFGALISIIAYLILIPIWGMEGAAMASSIGYFCLSLAGWLLLFKNYKIRFLDFFSIQSEDWIWLRTYIKQWHKSQTILTTNVKLGERI